MKLARFEARISHEQCSEFFPVNVEPFFCGSEKIRKHFSHNFPPKNKKEKTNELLQERRENKVFVQDILGTSGTHTSGYP